MGGRRGSSAAAATVGARRCWHAALCPTDLRIVEQDLLRLHLRIISGHLIVGEVVGSPKGCWQEAGSPVISAQSGGGRSNASRAA